MAETLYKRCPGCDRFVPETNNFCTHCGRPFDPRPPQPRTRKRWVPAAVFGGVLLLIGVALALEVWRDPFSPGAMATSHPTWTRTPLPTPSRVAAARADTEPTPAPTPTPGPVVLVERGMNIRGGPGTFYPITGSAGPGDQFPIIGRNPVGDWWRIRYRGAPAWIYAPLVTADHVQDATISVFLPPKLTSAQIFSKVSPAIAYVRTDESSGSGILIEGRYLVTNHHVVYPYSSVRVVFPSGAAYDSVPVKGWDEETDLAVLGPIDTRTEPVPLIDGESTPVGADMYLIGYPAEFESFPQPTIVKGILSRLRESGPNGITFFQTDTSIAGGQSGGALVSDTGAVIGISGSGFAEGKFALVASSADLLPRIRQLIAGGGDPVRRSRTRGAAVHYDGGIDLLGLGLQQGEERLSTRETISLRDDLPLWVGMRWQTAPGLRIDYAISLRLHDAWGRQASQQDEVLTDAGGWTTSRWTRREPVDTWFALDIPAGLPPGEYELRLVVYNVDTLTPTVEIDVWESEVVLARLQWT